MNERRFNKENLEIRVTRLEEKLDAAEDALSLSKSELDRRLSEMNELRHQISSERGIYLTRVEYESKQGGIYTILSGLQKFQWTAMGALLVIQIAVAIFLHYMR